MERPSVIHVAPPKPPASGSVGDSGESQSESSEKPKRSRKTSRAIREEKEAESETKRLLYLSAIEDVKIGKYVSSWAASKHYDILSYPMLREYVKNDTEWKGSGKQLQVLTAQEEKKIADHCIWRQERGFGYKHHDVALLIQASNQQPV